MIKSMTGYGKAECAHGNKKLLIEIRSLNSKYFDFNARLPNSLRELEPELRNQVAGRLERGKIEFNLTFDESSPEGAVMINEQLVRNYHAHLKSLALELEPDNTPELLPVVMRFPEVFAPVRETIDESFLESIREAVDRALDQIDEYRIEEGNGLLPDFRLRIDQILKYLARVPEYEEERLNILRSRLRKAASEVVTEEEYDKNRFEQELIYYLDRLDISEEKTRLEKHCNYFLETLAGEKSEGKKLSFIAQEIGREINTLGSKASESNIQRLVVQMKDELEKIKEQLHNIL